MNAATGIWTQDCAFNSNQVYNDTIFKQKLIKKTNFTNFEEQKFTFSKFFSLLKFSWNKQWTNENSESLGHFFKNCPLHNQKNINLRSEMYSWLVLLISGGTLVQYRIRLFFCFKVWVIVRKVKSNFHTLELWYNGRSL